MRRLRTQAYNRSRVPYSAVEAARNGNLYERLGWDTFCRLAEDFYSRVFSDEDWFRDIFANATRDAAVRNQSEFLAQEFGGPQLYRERKGHTAILGRHGPYPLSERAAERWLEHMGGAVASVVVDAESRDLLMGYFNHMAWYIVYGHELVSGMRTVGYFGKHKEGEV